MLSPMFHELLEAAQESTEPITVKELLTTLREQPPLLLDVREREECVGGKIAGAIVVPRGVIELEIQGLAPNRETPIVVYCQTGVRSAFAAQSLQQLGYQHVRDLRVGIEGWRAAGHPLEQPRAPIDEARYRRQIQLPEIGLQGQARLQRARVLLCGAGGIGSIVSLYLTAAGVGELVLVDSDRVELSNLHRQIVHSQRRIGQPKVLSACETLRELNSRVHTRALEAHIDRDWLADFFRTSSCDLVIDGTDNSETRYAINDACVRAQVPLICAAAQGWSGQLTTVIAGFACYRCLFCGNASHPASCASAGVIGPVVGTVGSLAAVEAIGILVGRPSVWQQRLLMFDGRDGTFLSTRYQRNPQCPTCSFLHK